MDEGDYKIVIHEDTPTSLFQEEKILNNDNKIVWRQTSASHYLVHINLYWVGLLQFIPYPSAIYFPWKFGHTTHVSKTFNGSSARDANLIAL